jgi:hypothetical protein
VQKRACFCAACLDFNFKECKNEDASPVESRTISRGNASVVQARGRTKTCTSQEDHRHSLALLAAPESLIGITVPTQAQLAFVRVTDALHEVVGSLTCPVTKSHFPEGDKVLKGKWLVRDGHSNFFKASGAQDIVFSASNVRTAPLPFEPLQDSNLEILEDVSRMAQEYLT